MVRADDIRLLVASLFAFFTTESLNLQLGLHVTDEITRSPQRISTAVLFVIQQRLHSSKPYRVALALSVSAITNGSDLNNIDHAAAGHVRQEQWPRIRQIYQQGIHEIARFNR